MTEPPRRDCARTAVALATTTHDTSVTSTVDRASRVAQIFAAVMKWFFAIWGGTVAILVIAFVGFVASRDASPELNQIFARVMLYDLYAIGVVMAYVAFVGAWHIWERLTGRMELEKDHAKRAAEAGEDESARG